MQLSEFRDLLANDGFAATFQTMGQYRTELLRALDGFRAQADARTVAIPTIEGAKLELHSDLHLKDLRLLGCHIITNGFKVHAHSQEAIESCVLVGAKPYTHPEASAPGLSEIACDLPYLFGRASNEGHEAGQRLAKEVQAKMNAILTRASAATVAEPSEPAPKVGEPYTFSNAADVLRAKRDGTQFYLRDGDRAPVKVDSIKGREHGVYVGGKGIMPYWITPNGYGERPDIWLFAAQQQAEPGADEREVLRIAEQFGWAVKRLHPKGDEWVLAHSHTKQRFLEMIRAIIAAQSGQRAGVAEDIGVLKLNPLTPYGMLVRALRIVANATLAEMAAYVGKSAAHLSAMEFGRKEVSTKDFLDASNFFYSKGITHTSPALDIARTARTEFAAAPTQQQGGGDV